MVGIPTGRCQAQIDRNSRTIRLEQQQSKEAHANGIMGKILNELLQQISGRLEHLFLV